MSKKEEAEQPYSYTQAFWKVLDEHTCLANQHELIAEKLKTNVYVAAQTKGKELRDSRTKV